MVYVPTELRAAAEAGVEAFRRYRELGTEIAAANARAVGPRAKAPAMITRRHHQRQLFETLLGSVEEFVAGLVDPELQRLDKVLADESLVEAVVERLAQRRPESRKRGRPGTPAEVALRMLVLKRLKGWSFADTEREVRASLVYRLLTRVYLERVPDAKTLIRLSGVVRPEGVRGDPPTPRGDGARAGRLRGASGTSRHDGHGDEHSLSHRLEPLGRRRARADPRDEAHQDRNRRGRAQSA